MVLRIDRALPSSGRGGPVDGEGGLELGVGGEVVNGVDAERGRQRGGVARADSFERGHRAGGELCPGLSGVCLLDQPVKSAG